MKRTNKQYEENSIKTSLITTTIATSTTSTTTNSNNNSNVNNMKRSLSMYTTEMNYDCSKLVLMIDK